MSRLIQINPVNPTMTTLHIVRHGEVHNPRKIFYGRMPRYHLSETGWQQAQAAGAYLADRPLHAVISSPRLRARQTALAVAGPHALPIRQSRLIDEINSPHQGRPVAELDAEGWILYENLPPDYETPEAVLARALRLVERLRREYPGQEIAAVTHGDVVLALRFWVEGIRFTDDTKNRVRLYPAPASITTLTFTNGSALPDMAYHRPY